MAVRMRGTNGQAQLATASRRLLALLAVLAVVAVACGDDDGGEASDDTVAEDTTAESTTEPSEGGAVDATITIEDFSFGEPVSIATGGSVLVENADGVTHTFTADDGSFDTGNIAGGSSAELTFDSSGTFPFHCEIHSSMTGTITVGDDGGGGDEGTADESAAGDVPTSPAEITASDQEGDGSEVVVDSVTLPASGYIVVHADADGAPGPILGHTELLAEGTSTDVVVLLDSPLETTAVVWPMAHVDANGNALYEFNPPDETTDVPAMFEGGEVAVIPITVTVG